MTGSQTALSNGTVRQPGKTREIRKFSIVVMSFFLVLFIAELFFNLHHKMLDKVTREYLQHHSPVRPRAFALDTVWICEKMVNNRPFNRDSAFSVSQKAVWCYARITRNINEETPLTVNWFRKNEKMATRKMTVFKGDSVLSSRLKLTKGYEGEWSVDILAEDNRLVNTGFFSIE